MLYTQILNEITCQYHMPENGRPNSAANSPAGARKFRCRPTRQDRPKWLISNISWRRGSDFRGSRPVFSLLAGKADSAAREGVDLGPARRRLVGDPALAAVGAREHAGPADAEDGTRPPAADQDRVHVDGIVVQVLAVAQILPMLAAVGRADGAADLDRTIEELRLAGAGVEPQHALGRVGTRCRRDLREADRDGQARPVFAGVVAAVDLAILAADEDHVGIVRVEQDRPHRQAVIGEVDLLPVLAAVGAAIGTGLRARIKDLG